MELIDAHTHSYLRGPEELGRMAVAGVRAVVVCAYLPVKPSSPATLGDLFEWVTVAEKERLARLGLLAIPAVGIHPRCIPEHGLGEALERLAAVLASGGARVLGEVGLESGDPREQEALGAQLRLAAASPNIACVLHTPRQGKREALRRMLAMLAQSGIDPARALIDHLTAELVPEVLAAGAYAGLTVQRGKLSVEDVVAIVRRHGSSRFVADSDLSQAPGEPLAVVQAAAALRAAVDDETAVAVCGGNARAWLRLP